MITKEMLRELGWDDALIAAVLRRAESLNEAMPEIPTIVAPVNEGEAIASNQVTVAQHLFYGSDRIPPRRHSL